KEKRLILDNRAAHASTKLVEVAWRPASRRCCNLVDHVVSIQRFVTVKPETASVKFVRSGFRHNIDHSTASAAELGRIAVRIDLRPSGFDDGDLLGDGNFLSGPRYREADGKSNGLSHRQRHTSLFKS